MTKPAKTMDRRGQSDPIPAAALAWVVGGYRSLDLEVELALDARAAGCSQGELEGQGVVARDAYFALLQRALARVPSFAVEAGKRCPFGTFRLLDCTTAACASRRHAIEALVRYFAIISDRGQWQWRSPYLELTPSPLPPRLAQASLEFGLHYTAARLDQLASSPAVLGVEVPWPEPPWSSAYPHPTRYSSKHAALVLDERVLDVPSRRADPLVADLLASNAAALLDALPKATSVRAEVHEAIVALLPHGVPRIHDVARRLATSERTLRRRLADDGLTFAGVRDRALEALARKSLRDPRRSVAQVAYATGFADARAFHRAFVRWTGSTPAQFRRSLEDTPS